MMPSVWPSLLGLLLFAVAAVAYLVASRRSAENTAISRLAIGTVALGTVFIIWATAASWSTNQDNTTAYLLAAVLGSMAVIGHRWLPLAGALVAPLVTLILLIQFFIAAPRADVPSADSSSNLVVAIHVAPAVLGQAFAILACAISLFYLWQQNLLKRKMLNQIPAGLPAISRLDRMLIISLWAGFLFLTVSLVSGAFYTKIARGGMGGLELKVAWAISVWLWYLATIMARNSFGQSGRRIALLSLVGFLLLAGTYFGMGFFTLGGGPA